MDSKRESGKQTQAADYFFPTFFFLSSPLPDSHFFTLEIIPKQVKEVTHYCTMTYKNKEMFIALLTCYFQKYISTAALNQE